ncbi:thymidine phosphorylase family protein [Pontibacter cellulosilyticus]|uniref:thymidine phosphorylase n=1 Tax=Pontibacter cellulosilyticus TaxID=1720253 RepID=A0A923N454_9BACT|nr:thymidine phosphorylase family protein [Pontibacter cellulosilyticus]MBC5991896.1 thymidine phosphorylase family protein [Pontibacter cellulosilyticus]
MKENNSNILRLRRLGIDTHTEHIIFMRADSPICRSEGFTANTRVAVNYGGRSITATLNVITSGLIGDGEAALSEEAFAKLNVQEGDLITVTHLQPILSFSEVRAKMFGKKLNDTVIQRIISDITRGLYSKIEIAAFVTVCSGDNLALDEVIYLTKAMINSGSRLEWDEPMIVDKHCVGGLPGNRTTPIVVPIVAAAGLLIPKTSSRAITSPAGTADVIETMTPVNLGLEQIKHVVRQEGGCMAWGGAVKLSPVDDVIISVEKALDVDSAGQMIASVLSKKAAAGSTHVVIDIPVGDTAKVRSKEEAFLLEYYLRAVGLSIGMGVEVMITDGSQPVGRGIGPALEAIDVLSVLRNEPDAPEDLKSRSVQLAGLMLEKAGAAPDGKGAARALEILESGQALDKFYRICEAQGGFKEPVTAGLRHDVLAMTNGVVRSVDNRKLAKVGKLAGAPKSPGAGIYFNAPIGKHIQKGDTLFTIYAASQGELNYALTYLHGSSHIVELAAI